MKLLSTVVVFLLSAFLLLSAQSMFAQLTGTKTIPGDYATVAAAVTDLNTQGVGAGGVTFNVAADYVEIAPAGGFTITATGTVANPIIFQKSGAGINPTFFAFAPQAVGVLHDAIFEILGGDYITLDGFTMSENVFNTVTAAATNDMTEWGVAVLYATTTDGAQNVTIKNCTIDLNRTYQNTFGIYSNSNHSSTAVTTGVSATTTAGGNSGLKIHANTITDVNEGIVVVGPSGAAADHNDVLEIGGTAPNGNTITNYGNTATFSSYFAVSGTVFGVLVRNTKNYNVSYNNITSSSGASGVVSGTLRGIYVTAFSIAPTGTFTNNVNNNTIAVTSHVLAGALQGISVEVTTSTITSTTNINNNNLTTINHTFAAATGAINGILHSGSSTVGPLNHSISNNTFDSLTSSSTGSFTFIGNSWARPTSGVGNVNNNSIVTGFSKTGAGNTVTFYTSNSTSGATITETNTGNNFSNVIVTGATTIAGWATTDGGSPTKTITGNTFSNITGGTSAITGLAVSFSGASNVSNNLVSNITGAGTITGITSSSGTETFSQNTVHTLTGTGTGVVTGILNSGGTTKTISRNKVYNLENSNAAGSASGITVSAGTTVNVQNNLVGDISAPNLSATNSLFGINISGGTTVNAYFNTVYLNATSVGANFGSSALNASGAAAFTMRNNILVNTSTPAGTGLTVAYRRTSTTLTTYDAASNNNDLYAGTPSATNLIFNDGTNSDQTIADFKTRVTPRDAVSFTENPSFLSDIGASPDFLHINTIIATQIESGGTAVAGITNDYDGDTRNVTTPDVGADEFAGVALDLTGPTIVYTPLGNTAGTSSRTLTATITDASGVPTAGAGLPVLYWKINAGAYTAATATSLGSNQYQFTFGAGVVTGDVVSYYICAQDNASNAAQDNGGVPNVSCSPSAGASGFSSNPPAVSTPPTTPSTYSILQTISGTFTVGAAGTYTTLTAAIADINGKVLNGPVILNLIDPTYTAPPETFPITILANPGSSATNTLTIKPLGSTIISGASTIFILSGASYVTIDGIALAGANDAPRNGRIRNRDSQNATVPTDVTKSADVIKSATVVSPKAQPVPIASGPISISASLTGMSDYSEKVQPADLPQQVEQTEIVTTTDNVVVNPLTLNDGAESLLIRNASAAGSAITFINDATNNTVKNSTIESGNTSATSGTILFSTSTGTLGNSNNAITNNKIRDRTDAAGVPANAIYSAGTGAAPNATNTISFNQIFNYTTAGVLLSATGIGNVWNISFNSLYQTAARTAALTGVSVQGGGGHNVASNIIGGSDFQGLGSPTTISTGLLQGISLLVTASPTTIVNGNFITNLSNTGTSFPNFNGIIVAGGNVNITSNTIGGGFLASDTVRTNEDTYGFRNTGAGTVLIQGNTWRFVRNYLTTLHDMRPIIVSAGTATIKNNTIGSTYDVNAPSTSFFMAGITLATATSGNIVEGNTVSNLHSDGTGVNVFNLGMFIGSVLSFPNPTEIRQNRIHTITGNGTPTLIYGIYKLSGDATYSNNMIALGETQALNPFIGGIRDDGAAGTNNWYFNSVSITGASDVAATQSTYAFFRSGTATLNIRDNIFANMRTAGTGFHVAIANTNAAATGWGAGASDNNIFNGNPVTIGQWLTAGVPSDLATWRTNSAGDAASTQYPITFATATDLHLAAVHLGDPNLAGVTIAGITTDFDGATRSLVGPYIGADELPTPTPIQLAYLTAILNNSGRVNVRWGTISEINNYGFEVQKAQNSATNFAMIPGSFIAGHGTTNEPQHYAFVDNTTQGGVWYYRLKQIDLDGTLHYTEPVRVDVLTGVEEIAPIEFALRQNYPNPFNPSTEIKFSVETTGKATLEVYNLLGQKVATLFDGFAEAGQYHKVRLDASSLASGMYLYRLASGSKSDLKKMLLLK